MFGITRRVVGRGSLVTSRCLSLELCAEKVAKKKKNAHNYTLAQFYTPSVAGGDMP